MRPIFSKLSPWTFLWITLIGGLSPGNVAHADFFLGATDPALGGAGVAGVSGVQSALKNPALIPIYETTSIGLYFRDGELAAGQHRWAAGIGAIDNEADIWIPGAFHYLRLRDTGLASGPANSELWHMAVGRRVGQHFSMGLSAYRLSSHVIGDQTYTQWNGSIGLLYMFNAGLGFGYVLNNPVHPGFNLPRLLRQNMRQVAGIFAALGSMARLRFDVARDEEFNPHRKLTYMFGFESKTSETLVMRIGYRYDDQTIQHIWTAGVGFDGPRLKASYSFEKNQEGISGALHSVDISVPF